MYTVALLTFMAIGGFPSFVEDVKVDSSPFQKVALVSCSRQIYSQLP